MALRVASILGAGCLSQQLLPALGQETETEFFPLSGGIDNGVEVQVSFDSIADAGAAKIEFVDRERRAAFRFVIDKASKTVTREASEGFSDPAPETFGGWPDLLDAEAPPRLKFTKRRHDIAVSIGGLRFPWYDFRNRKTTGQEEAPLLTHIAVTYGFANPEVVLSRPMCTTKCNRHECLDGAGKHVCLVEGGCFSVTMSSTPGVASSCSTSQETTPGGNSHCCDGDEAPPPARGSLTAESYISLVSNSAYFIRVCKAFGDCASEDPEKVEKKAHLFNGAIAIVRRNASEDGMYTVFVPQALSIATRRAENNVLPADVLFKLPRFALHEAGEPTKKTIEVPQGDLSEIMAIDAFYDIIVTSSVDKVRNGWFTHLASYDWRGKQRVAKLTRRAWALFKSGSRVNRTLYVSNQNIDADIGTCTNFEMIDANGDACDSYDAKCNIHGFATDSGCESWGKEPGCRLPSGSETPGSSISEAAAILCCACGGGSWSPPSEWGDAAEAAQTNPLIFK